jgi:hypothetical protein
MIAGRLADVQAGLPYLLRQICCGPCVLNQRRCDCVCFWNEEEAMAPRVSILKQSFPDRSRTTDYSSIGPPTKILSSFGEFHWRLADRP